MKPLACRYSIIQFVPFVETGEFANIGIVLTCPQTGYFNFLLQDKKSKRVTDFFEAVDRSYYLKAVKAVEEELMRMRVVAHQLAPEVKPDAIRGMLNALTQPREAIVRFSAVRVLLTQDPVRELKEKFDHYIDHSFATVEYVENTMNAQLKGLLAGLQLLAPFKPARIGNETVNAKFDFVQTVDSKHKKVIKALNLSHKETNDIAAHGDVWLGKITRLKRSQELPREVLINVAIPKPSNVAHYALSQEIIHELDSHDILVVQGYGPDAQRKIRMFAEA